MVNRRQLLVVAGASALSVRGRAAAEDSPTAEASPPPSRKPKSIELAPGLRLSDYRIVETSEGPSVFIGEVVNETDFAADTPSLLQTFYDADDNILGENRVYGIVGAIRPHQRDYLINNNYQFLQFDPAREEYDHFAISLENGAGDWPSQIQMQYTYDIGLEIDKVIEKNISTESFSAVVDAINLSDHDVYGGFLISVFLDSSKRFVGYAREEIDSTVAPGKKVRFRTYVDKDYFGYFFNPFPHLAEDEQFYVRTVVIGKAYE